MTHTYNNLFWPYTYGDALTYSVATHAIHDMFRQDKYEVPRYQRGYAWTSTQVNQFWEDLTKAVDKNGHFFGTIYIDGNDKILDGQQRTTTVFLLLLAAKDYLKTKDATNKMIKDLDEYLFNGARPKITLSRFNNEYFQELVHDSPNIEKPPIEFENDSNLNMYKAYCNLQDKIKQYENEQGLSSIEDLIRKLLNNFRVIQVTVKNSSDAYSMFNLVNNRGMPLTQYDLIRNYIFAELEQLANVDEAKIEDVDKKWNRIAKNIRKTTNYSIDIFIQHILSFEHDVSVKDIFKQLKNNVPASELLKWVAKAENWSVIVNTLRKPTGHFCDHAGKSCDCEGYIKRINDLGAVAVYPLLMVGFDKYWNKGDHVSFDNLVEACFKYHLGTKTIRNISAGEYQGGLFKIARYFYNNECKVNEIIDMLCNTSSYVSGNDLESLLALYKPNRKAAVILLELIEEKDSDTISNNKVTIEHIMPKKLTKWLKYICKTHDDCSEEYAKQIHQTYVERLGNLALLNKIPNSSLGDKSFSDKKKVYANSNHTLTKRLARLDKWNRAQIESRQQTLAKTIVKLLDISLLKTK